MRAKGQTDLTTCILYIIGRAGEKLYEKNPEHPLLAMVEFIPLPGAVVQMNATQEFYELFAPPDSHNRVIFTLVNYNDALVKACHGLSYSP